MARNQAADVEERRDRLLLDTARAPQWTVEHASLDDHWAATGLLGALREAGADDAVDAQLARDSVGQVNLNDPLPDTFIGTNDAG